MRGRCSDQFRARAFSRGAGSSLLRFRLRRRDHRAIARKRYQPREPEQTLDGQGGSVSRGLRSAFQSIHSAQNDRLDAVERLAVQIADVRSICGLLRSALEAGVGPKDTDRPHGLLPRALWTRAARSAHRPRSDPEGEPKSDRALRQALPEHVRRRFIHRRDCMGAYIQPRAFRHAVGSGGWCGATLMSTGRARANSCRIWRRRDRHMQVTGRATSDRLGNHPSMRALARASERLRTPNLS